MCWSPRGPNYPHSPRIEGPTPLHPLTLQLSVASEAAMAAAPVSRIMGGGAPVLAPTLSAHLGFTAAGASGGFR